MKTNGNNILELGANSRPYGIDETVADENLPVVLELDAEMYGKHAQGKYAEQVSVWELCNLTAADEGKHRK